MTILEFLATKKGQRARVLLDEIDCGIMLLASRRNGRFVSVFLDTNGINLTRGYPGDRLFSRGAYEKPVKILNPTMIATFLNARRSRRVGGPDIVRYVTEVLDEIAQEVLS